MLKKKKEKEKEKTSIVQVDQRINQGIHIPSIISQMPCVTMRMQHLSTQMNKTERVQKREYKWKKGRESMNFPSMKKFINIALFILSQNIKFS